MRRRASSIKYSCVATGRATKQSSSKIAVAMETGRKDRDNEAVERGQARSYPRGWLGFTSRPGYACAPNRGYGSPDGISERPAILRWPQSNYRGRFSADATTASLTSNRPTGLRSGMRAARQTALTDEGKSPCRHVKQQPQKRL